MIYRFALAQGATHWCCKHPVGHIGIEDMLSDDFEEYKDSHPQRSRTLYEPLTHPYHCDPDHHVAVCGETTYKLGNSFSLPGFGLLALNKHTRSEAIPIFYGENKFLFRTTASIRPFLHDRPSAARQHIRSVELVLELSYTDHGHRERQRAWIKAFQYLQHHLHLRTLDVRVADYSIDFTGVTSIVGWEKQWVRALARITDLDHFGLKWEFVGREGYIEYMIDTGDWMDDDDDDLDVKLEMLDAWMERTEEVYGGYLRSRMLKQRQRSLDAWLQRHVCDARCEEVSKGRAAVPPGLPPSTTHGLWKVPRVELDRYYDSTNADDPSVEEYTDAEDSADEDEENVAEQGNNTDAEDSADEDEDDVAEQGNNTGAESDKTFHTCQEDPHRTVSIEL
ncbi:MAG: hypothetical protein Q9193_003358 [Seirophora villosa]